MTSFTVSTHTKDKDLVPTALQLYRIIFEIEEEEEEETRSKYTDVSIWRKRATEGSLLVAFEEDDDDRCRPIGFVLAYPRQKENTEEHQFHIWLAGVLETCRGRGVWNELLGLTRRHATESRCIHELSIFTFPSKFPVMYKSLLKKGFEVVGGSEDFVRSGDGKVKLVWKTKRRTSQPLPRS